MREAGGGNFQPNGAYADDNYKLKDYTISLGDVVGYALETDTAVYFDGKYVKSYAVGPKNVIDIDELNQFGYTIKRDLKNKLISIIQDKKRRKSNIAIKSTNWTCWSAIPCSRSSQTM